MLSGACWDRWRRRLLNAPSFSDSALGYSFSWWLRYYLQLTQRAGDDWAWVLLSHGPQSWILNGQAALSSGALWMARSGRFNACGPRSRWRSGHERSGRNISFTPACRRCHRWSCNDHRRQSGQPAQCHADVMYAFYLTFIKETPVVLFNHPTTNLHEILRWNYPHLFKDTNMKKICPDLWKGVRLVLIKS